MTRGFGNDRRAVSITVTHVMTIAITTILIAMLVTTASSMLETETERSAEASLETIGERLADEIGNVDRMAESDGGEVNVTTSHPRTVANSGYTVELLESSRCADAPLLTSSTDCLRLTTHGSDTVVHVPVKTDTPLDDGETARGGRIELRYDDDEDEITIAEAG